MSIHILSSNVTIGSWKHLHSTMIVWAKVRLPILWSLRWPSFPMFSWDFGLEIPGTDPGWEPSSRGWSSRLPSALAGLRAPWCEGLPLWRQEEQEAFASAAEEVRKPKGLFRTIPFLPSHSSQISSMMRRNFFSFSWPKMTPWSLGLPPLAFFPRSVLTCIIFVNLLSSRSVLCLSWSLLWSLLSSSPCPLFLGRNAGINLQERSNKTELVDVWNLWQRSVYMFKVWVIFWTYQQIHSLMVERKGSGFFVG